MLRQQLRWLAGRWLVLKLVLMLERRVGLELDGQFLWQLWQRQRYADVGISPPGADVGLRSAGV